MTPNIDAECLFVVRASTHLNFQPGTMSPMPPGLNHHIESKPMTLAEARSAIVEWKAICEDRWSVTIEPAPAAKGGA